MFLLFLAGDSEQYLFRWIAGVSGGDDVWAAKLPFDFLVTAYGYLDPSFRRYYHPLCISSAFYFCGPWDRHGRRYTE